MISASGTGPRPPPDRSNNGAAPSRYSWMPTPRRRCNVPLGRPSGWSLAPRTTMASAAPALDRGPPARKKRARRPRSGMALFLHDRVGAFDALSERRGEEAVDIAVEHRAGVAGLDPGAQVFHHLIGLQHVRPDLVAPADIGLG